MTEKKAFIIYEDEVKELIYHGLGLNSRFIEDQVYSRPTLTEKEAKLAGMVLEEASADFGDHSCNDAPEEWWEGWTIEERKAFYKAFEDYNSEGRDYDPKRYEMQDYSTAGFLAYKLGFRRPPVPKIKYLLTDEQVRSDSQIVENDNLPESPRCRCIYDGNNFIMYKFVKADGIHFKQSGWLRAYVSNVDKKDGEYPLFVPEHK